MGVFNRCKCYFLFFKEKKRLSKNDEACSTHRTNKKTFIGYRLVKQNPLITSHFNDFRIFRNFKVFELNFSFCKESVPSLCGNKPQGGNDFTCTVNKCKLYGDSCHFFSKIFNHAIQFFVLNNEVVS